MNQPAVFKHGKTQKLTIGAASVASTAISAGCRNVRIVSDGDCFIKIDNNPTATASEMPIFAKIPEYFHINDGDKVAVIQSGASTGSLYLTEATR